MKRILVAAALGLSCIVGPAEAQAGARAAERREARQEALMNGAPGGPKRQLLEQQVRQSFWRVAKNRIGFTDEQMRQLQQTSQRFDQRRRQLAQEEKTTRVTMRAQVLANSAANQAEIASSLDQLQQIQRQRVELQAEEQKEFATFMTPLQRAQLFALQEQVRRRVQEIVRARPDSAAVAGRGPAAP